MQLVAMTSINSKIGGGGGGTKYSEIEPAEPIKDPRHNIDLCELLDAVKKLMALKGAIDTGKTLLGGIDGVRQTQAEYQQMVQAKNRAQAAVQNLANSDGRSEEHTSELQSLMRISYAVFCLKKKNKTITKLNKDKYKKTDK